MPIHHLLQCPPNCIINRIKYRAVWRPVFRFNELRHIWAQVSNSVAWTMCRRSRPAETDWGALQQMVYRRKISDIDQLKHLDLLCGKITVVSLYVNVNWVKSMCSGHIYHNFTCCDDLSKFGKEYLNSLKCEFCTFFLEKFSKILTYCTPF